jgi:hypothetical protein
VTSFNQEDASTAKISRQNYGIDRLAAEKAVKIESLQRSPVGQE